MDVPRVHTTVPGNGEKGNGAAPPARMENPIKVLMYHRIVTERKLSDAVWTCVHVDEFRRQLTLLERWGYTGITFNDYRLYLQGELNLPRKPVILTFDDGYLDTFQHAFPLLQEFGMRAVVFVLGDRKIGSNVWDADRHRHSAALMDEEHILELHQASFEVGSHSMTHVDLTALSDDLAWEEISVSRMLLEMLLNAPVRSFAYPFGAVNAQVKKMVAHAGYSFACGVFSGPPTCGLELLDIRRIGVTGRTGAVGLAFKLLGPYERFAWMRWKTKKMFGNKTTVGRNGTNRMRHHSKVFLDHEL